VTQKKGKQAAKDNIAVEADVQAEIAAEIAAPTPEKKGKKEKKRKSDVVLETTVVVEETPVVEVAPKSKKAKKDTNVVPAIEDSAEKKRKAKLEQDVAKPKKARKAKA
jgi:nucleolar protein 15